MVRLSLKAARANADLTQKNVAKRLNIHVQTYRKLEENPDMATVAQAKKLAEILQVPYDEIFFAS
jgi:DNA-binding XRE family transcriptional regulator